MKKALNIILILFITILCICGCGQNSGDETQNTNAQVSRENAESTPVDLASLKTYLLNPTKDNVEAFEQLFGTHTSYREDDVCDNVTPQGFSEDYGIQIFKYNQSCETYLMYANVIYLLGTSFGGYGVTSLAVSDINADGKYELYFTFSWGSGIHRSQIGYFDTASKAVTIFEYSDFNNEIMIGIGNENNISIYSSDFHINSFVNIIMEPKTKISDITFDGEDIVLNPPN